MQPHPPSYKRASVYTQKLLMSWSISLLLCCSIAQLSQPSAAQNTSTDDIALKEAGTADILVRLHGKQSGMLLTSLTNVLVQAL